MTDKLLTLKVLTPEGCVFEGSVDAVFVPGSAGRFEILPGHAAIVSTLDAGELKWRVGKEESAVQLRSGAIMLNDNLLSVCIEQVK